jgi:hypothetical protein
MEPKKYASYAEIDRDLEILKLEKEIQYQKLNLCLQKTKESFTPQGMIKSFLGSYKTLFSDNVMSIINIAIPYIIKWIMKRKRGD